MFAGYYGFLNASEPESGLMVCPPKTIIGSLFGKEAAPQNRLKDRGIDLWLESNN